MRKIFFYLAMSMSVVSFAPEQSGLLSKLFCCVRGTLICGKCVAETTAEVGLICCLFGCCACKLGCDKACGKKPESER